MTLCQVVELLAEATKSKRSEDLETCAKVRICSKVPSTCKYYQHGVLDVNVEGYKYAGKALKRHRRSPVQPGQR